ncbi:MAG TPA: AAA family ATPase [Candidatus Angelobacter sp.]|jgi:predicted ATPase|nr:AAA family ATPase [Candidatus Angelobacter sp.]
MGPVVHSLILKQFRSVPSGRIDFDNPTFLVGHNGSGKSNIADAFAFLAEAMDSPLHEILDRRGGIASIFHKTPDKNLSPNLGIAIECDYSQVLKSEIANFDSLDPELSRNIAAIRYAFEIKPLPEYRFEVDREQCIITRFDRSKGWFDRKKKKVETNVGLFAGKTTEVREESLALPIMGSINAFFPVLQVLRAMRVYSIEPSRLREMQDPDSGASLRRDGTNAASVLEEIRRRKPEDIPRIERFLSAIVPGTSSVSTMRHGQKLTLEFVHKWDNTKQLNFEAFNMSDGTLRAFALLLAVFQRETPSLILVEEPEASLHPAALGAVLDLLRHASKQMQVIVSTHSPEILDAKWIEDKHLRVVTWQEGATSVSGVSEMSKKALQQHLMGAGELLRSEALAPTALFEEVPQPYAELFEEVS